MGHPFIKHVYNAVAVVHPRQKVEMTDEVLEDVSMWFKFTKECRGWLPILDVE